MILIAGGTGRLGTQLVGWCNGHGQAVRVLTRDPARAAHLTGVEVAVGDVRSPADLATAVQGVSAVVSAVHGFAGPGRVTPASVDRDGNRLLIAAARTLGAHFVLISVLGASLSHPMELVRMKATAEADLRASGLPWTIVRAGPFLELHSDLMRRTAGRSHRPLVFGRGENPVTFSTIADVTTAVGRALTDPACRNAMIEAGGPTLTFNQLAARLAEELGPAARNPRHVPRPLLRAMAATGRGAPARKADAALAMDTHDFTWQDPSRTPPAEAGRSLLP